MPVLIDPFFVYLCIGFAIAIPVSLVVRHVGDYPFPWELRLRNAKASPPDSQALAECFSKLRENEQIHLIMGIVNYDVVWHEKLVKDSIYGAMERNVHIKLIHGPEIDQRSEEFLKILRDYPNAELYRYDEDPELHFRVLIGKDGPREVYVEEPHGPYNDLGYRHVKSNRIAKFYEGLFKEFLAKAEKYN